MNRLTASCIFSDVRGNQPSHCYTTALLHHCKASPLHATSSRCGTSPLHRRTATSSIATSPHSYMATPLHCHTATPLHCHTTIPQHCHTATPLHLCTAKPSLPKCKLNSRAENAKTFYSNFAAHFAAIITYIIRVIDHENIISYKQLTRHN